MLALTLLACSGWALLALLTLLRLLPLFLTLILASRLGLALFALRLPAALTLAAFFTTLPVFTLHVV